MFESINKNEDVYIMQPIAISEKLNKLLKAVENECHTKHLQRNEHDMKKTGDITKKPFTTRKIYKCEMNSDCQLKCYC